MLLPGCVKANALTPGQTPKAEAKAKGEVKANTKG